ncbi:caspase family protein [Pseudotabrizicola alkalilacus]|uniref:Caspase family p20 domain-containing protein n=1 Tax=Pseudotabrizicola alkalilacus TaxID=2305252 RepID=A0A411Z3I7_9RHOB|nr:caspase family protein [Pseudotabrizicola alkalilacus]RGP37624.1 hypothetical protein D1012_06785 [Pseudotabrizicola alkalilacus]
MLRIRHVARVCACHLRASALYLGLVLSGLLVSTPAAMAERFAFVVGMADYTTITPLKNAVQDARLIAETLQELGFKVEISENAPKAQLEAKLAAFRRSVPAGATVLIYFAGHGIQYSDENYLIPLDADIKEPADLPLAALPIKALLDQIYAADAESVILVLDACRNNPLGARSLGPATRSGGANRGLARISGDRTGTLVAFSTAPGEVALDGDGGNSPYTMALAEAMRKQGQSIEQVFKETRARVVETTSGRQVPWENSSLVQSIVLHPEIGQPEVVQAHQCDLAAAHPADPERVGPSVAFRSIDPQRAIPVCEAAVAEFPDQPRFKALLARAYDRAGRGEDSVRLSEAAMAQGYLAAWHQLGNLYLKGSGVAMDEARAFELFLYAAERGHVEDQHNIGVAYLNGRGVAKDEAKARAWFNRAIEQNWAASLNRLGLMMERGQGGAADIDGALAYYTRAVNLGDRDAMVNLGNAYRTGNGVDADLTYAVELYRRSALLGSRAAYAVLGHMFEVGEGVTSDALSAAFWLTLASRDGDTGALEALQRLRAGMDADTLEALRLRLEDWDQRQFG